MEFTIAIPVLNGGKTLMKTIESALNQDYNLPYEILVSNNGSKDNTADILNTYANEINIISRIDTVPMYENHNICLYNAKGKYILFCHSDDILMNNALTILQQIIHKRGNPRKYVIWGRSMFRDFYENWRYGNIQLNNILAGQSAVNPFIKGGLAPSGVCYSKDAFIEIGGFCKANLKLTPFDMSTMLKMAINSFEFEMIDRIIFIRKYASTAINIGPNELKDSVSDALCCLKDELDGVSYNYLAQCIVNSKIYAPEVLHFLLKDRLINKKETRKLVIKSLIKNPSSIFHIYFYKTVMLLV
ncbi:glycosyltransferase family 2 protein [Spirosoma gilvum]